MIKLLKRVMPLETKQLPDSCAKTIFRPLNPEANGISRSSRILSFLDTDRNGLNIITFFGHLHYHYHASSSLSGQDSVPKVDRKSWLFSGLLSSKSFPNVGFFKITNEWIRYFTFKFLLISLLKLQRLEWLLFQEGNLMLRSSGWSWQIWHLFDRQLRVYNSVSDEAI